MSRVIIDRVSKSYGAHKAVHEISLSVDDGEFLTLLGPSGCGKTTTLRMIAGLEQTSHGRVIIGNRIVDEVENGVWVPPERRGLGMVFQSYAIWPHMTVFDNVAYPLQVRRWPKDKIKVRVLEILEQVELSNLAKRSATALSGGQQQRVAIARALAATPDVLLLDEPLSNLDARLRAQMGEELRKLQQNMKVTTIYVTHDQAEALALSDRVVLMSEGRAIQSDSPANIYHRPINRAVGNFFGTPNFFEVAVTKCDKTGTSDYRLSVSLDGWETVVVSPEARSVGDQVTLMIRPESLMICDDARHRPGTSQLRGHVRSSIFKGPTSSVSVQFNERLINAELHSRDIPSEGAPILLGVLQSEIWALPKI
ncbi:ABC transporter ATP-binding protein [Microvirga zambiensis]|uniref:ABC transporter ATP-binding protein n=1 Tax=Microvirga zambiensis TaxID=1402137 RepID=UPI00191E95B7|nr:ABC transporter ATP-binding protein [Microvirga zambiensis]